MGRAVRAAIGGQIVQSFDDCNGGCGERGSSRACRKWRTAAAFLSVGWSASLRARSALLTLLGPRANRRRCFGAAEALLLTASVEGAIGLGDDFGDGLDAATAEHIAAELRAQAAQVWLTTPPARSDAGVRPRRHQDGESATITQRSWRAQTTSASRPAAASHRIWSAAVLGWSYAPSIAVTTSTGSGTTTSPSTNRPPGRSRSAMRAKRSASPAPSK